MLERICRVIRRAHDRDLKMLEQAARVKARLLQARIAGIEDLARRAFVEQFADPEGIFQLELRPMKERIAQRARHGAGPSLKLLEVRRVPGAQALGDAVGAHGAPLVVIPIEPNFGDGPKLVVRRHVLRREVAVVVDDGLRPRKGLVQIARGVGFEQKIFVEHLAKSSVELRSYLISWAASCRPRCVSRLSPEPPSWSWSRCRSWKAFRNSRLCRCLWRRSC